jgi:hypothetical protein
MVARETILLLVLIIPLTDRTLYIDIAHLTSLNLPPHQDAIRATTIEIPHLHLASVIRLADTDTESQHITLLGELDCTFLPLLTAQLSTSLYLPTVLPNSARHSPQTPD